MSRFLLTSLGVFALLLSAPPEVGAAELVRAGVSPSGMAPQVEAPTNGAAPREEAWSDVVSGAQLDTGLQPDERPGAAVSAIGAAAPATADRSGPTADFRLLPDARAPPA